MFQWLITINSITDVYNIILVLELLTILLILTLVYNGIKLTNDVFNYIIISSLGTIFFIIDFKTNIYITISFIMKLTYFPFNIWLIDIYKKFNNWLIIIWSILPKIIFIIIFNKFYWLFINNLFLLWSLFSIIFMSIYSFKLFKLNELLAISSIINNSYIFFVYDRQLYMIYYIIHILIISEFVNNKIINLFLSNKFAYLLFILWVLSIIGLPPLIGFNMKYIILDIGLNIKNIGYNIQNLLLQNNIQLYDISYLLINKTLLLIIGLILSSIYYIYLLKYSSSKHYKYSNKNIKIIKDINYKFKYKLLPIYSILLI